MIVGARGQVLPYAHGWNEHKQIGVRQIKVVCI